MSWHVGSLQRCSLFEWICLSLPSHWPKICFLCLWLGRSSYIRIVAHLLLCSPCKLSFGVCNGFIPSEKIGFPLFYAQTTIPLKRLVYMENSRAVSHSFHSSNWPLSVNSKVQQCDLPNTIYLQFQCSACWGHLVNYMSYDRFLRKSRRVGKGWVYVWSTN